jgi:hypothetical protein
MSDSNDTWKQAHWNALHAAKDASKELARLESRMLGADDFRASVHARIVKCGALAAELQRTLEIVGEHLPSDYRQKGDRQ